MSAQWPLRCFSVTKTAELTEITQNLQETYAL